MTTYNPIVTVRFTLSPVGRGKMFKVETTFDELFLDNPWLENLRAEITDSLQKFDSYWDIDESLEIAVVKDITVVPCK